MSLFASRDRISCIWGMCSATSLKIDQAGNTQTREPHITVSVRFIISSLLSQQNLGTLLRHSWVLPKRKIELQHHLLNFSLVWYPQTGESSLSMRAQHKMIRLFRWAASLGTPQRLYTDLVPLFQSGVTTNSILLFWERPWLLSLDAMGRVSE